MSNLFKKPKAAPAPDPNVERRLAANEERTERAEVDTRRRLAARKSARAGRSTLMTTLDPTQAVSSAREVLGRTLGAGRNPRG